MLPSLRELPVRHREAATKADQEKSDPRAGPKGHRWDPSVHLGGKGDITEGFLHGGTFKLGPKA